MLSTEINKRFKFFYRSFTESNSALNRCRFRCVDMGDAFFALSTKRKHKRIDYWRSRIQKFSTYFDYELFFMWTNQSFLFWKKKQKKKTRRKIVLNLHVIVAHIWTLNGCAVNCAHVSCDGETVKLWNWVNGKTPHSWITLILFNRFSIHQLNCFLPSRPSTCAAVGLAFAIDDFSTK